MNRTTLYIRILLIGLSLLAFGVSSFIAYKHLTYKEEQREQTSDETLNVETFSEEEEVLNPITVYTIGEGTFKNDENITFKNIDLNDISIDSPPLYLLAHKDLMTVGNQELFNKLAESGHSILFYGEEIDPGAVVMYFDTKIMVVDMQSTVPLSFQAYGISTLNEQFIPLMIQTTGATEIDVDAIYSLFNQHKNLS